VEKALNMIKQAFTISGAPQKAGPYSHAVIMNGFVFVSGQGPINPVSNQISGLTIEEQTCQVLDNIKFILERVGSDMEHVVKVNVYLQNLADFQAFNKAYEKYFPREQPVRTTIGANLPKILVEIDCIAGLA
jgi:2-iminobutanoate/2-iminopropanoate deaminase